MKLKAALVLVAFFLSLAAPLSVQISASGGAPILVTLDVCNAAGAALSVNADIPGIQEYPCLLAPPAFSGYVDISHPESFLPITASNQGHPPEA